MVPEDNLPVRVGVWTETPPREDPAKTKAAERSIDVIFDPELPGQAKVLEGHRAAFGDDHWEVEALGNGKVVLRLYPGGARRLP